MLRPIKCPLLMLENEEHPTIWNYCSAGQLTYVLALLSYTSDTNWVTGLCRLTWSCRYRVGDSEFSAACSAQGKPKPSIRWLKDGHLIISDPKLYDIFTDESESHNSVFTVQSTLRFVGHSRPEGNQLLPADRGLYSCTFENEVKRAESSMHLRIEREFLNWLLCCW
jgi:hypothetical protein